MYIGNVSIEITQLLLVKMSTSEEDQITALIEEFLIKYNHLQKDFLFKFQKVSFLTGNNGKKYNF